MLIINENTGYIDASLNSIFFVNRDYDKDYPINYIRKIEFIVDKFKHNKEYLMRCSYSCTENGKYCRGQTITNKNDIVAEIPITVVHNNFKITNLFNIVLYPYYDSTFIQVQKVKNYFESHKEIIPINREYCKNLDIKLITFNEHTICNIEHKSFDKISIKIEKLAKRIGIKPINNINIIKN